MRAFERRYRPPADGLQLDQKDEQDPALIAVSSTTDRYAAPALVLIAIFAFVVIRLRFIFALVAAGTYLVGYVVVVTIGPTRGTVLDVFLVGAAILAGLDATSYSCAERAMSPHSGKVAERSSRTWHIDPAASLVQADLAQAQCGRASADFGWPDGRPVRRGRPGPTVFSPINAIGAPQVVGVWPALEATTDAP